MKVIMSLNHFANRCGYFFNGAIAEGYEDRPVVNNGYNCSHPECGDEEDGIGCCRTDTCPLAYPADGLICQRSGMQCSECGCEECECDDDEMVVEIADNDFDSRYMIRAVDEESLALNDRLDYPIAALHWKDADPDDLWAGLEHFFCVAPGGVYVDVRGTTDDFQAFCMEFSSPKYFRVLKNLDAAQLKRDLMQEMGESNLSILYGEAVAEIKSNLANYKI